MICFTRPSLDVKSKCEQTTQHVSSGNFAQTADEVPSPQTNMEPDKAPGLQGPRSARHHVSGFMFVRRQVRKARKSFCLLGGLSIHWPTDFLRPELKRQLPMTCTMPLELCDLNIPLVDCDFF